MILFQLTTSKLRETDSKWRSTINRFRGPVPPGLGIAHIVALSNGVEDPAPRDPRTRPIGLTQVPTRAGRALGYKEADLIKPGNNIYAWAAKTNQDAVALHQAYPQSWTKAGYDFWLTVHLYFLMTTAFYALMLASDATSTTDGVIGALTAWVRNSMQETQRFGTFSTKDLRRIVDHLDSMRTALVTLDGPDKSVSTTFGAEVTTNPGSVMDVLKTTAGT